MNKSSFPLMLKKIKSVIVLFSEYLNLLIFFAAIIVITYLFINKKEFILPVIQNIRIKYLFLSFSSILIGLIIAAYVWHSIKNNFGIKISLKENFNIYISSMLGTVLPGSLWGVANRLSEYRKLDESQTTILISSAFEAIIISFGSLLIFSLSLLFVKIDPFLNLSIAWIILFIIFAIVLINPKVITKTTNFIIKKQKYGSKSITTKYTYSDLLVWIVLESIVSFLGALGVFFLLNAIYFIDFSMLPLIVSAWTVTNAISSFLIWVPGTLFLRDGFFLLVLSTLVSPSEALVFTVIQRIWLSLIIVGNVVILFIYKKFFTKKGENG